MQTPEADSLKDQVVDRYIKEIKASSFYRIMRPVNSLVTFKEYWLWYSGSNGEQYCANLFANSYHDIYSLAFGVKQAKLFRTLAPGEAGYHWHMSVDYNADKMDQGHWRGHMTDHFNKWVHIPGFAYGSAEGTKEEELAYLREIVQAKPDLEATRAHFLQSSSEQSQYEWGWSRDETITVDTLLAMTRS